MTDPHNRSNKSLHDDISETENHIEINEKVKIKEQNFIFLMIIHLWFEKSLSSKL